MLDSPIDKFQLKKTSFRPRIKILNTANLQINISISDFVCWQQSNLIVCCGKRCVRGKRLTTRGHCELAFTGEFSFRSENFFPPFRSMEDLKGTSWIY